MFPFHKSQKKKHKNRDSVGSTSSSSSSQSDIQVDGPTENQAFRNCRTSTGSSEGTSDGTNSGSELGSRTSLYKKSASNGTAKTNGLSTDNQIEPDLTNMVLENGEATEKIANSIQKLSSVDCTKHPGHKEFIPINELQPQNLLPQYQDKNWVKFIQLKGYETVLIEVGFTSPDRPEDFGYAELKGKKDKRIGSGTAFIWKMGEIEECSCSETTGPHHISGFFKVMTVAHVVFDDEEATNSIISFFYDDVSSSKVTARGVRVSHIDIQRNRSVIECRTHNMTLYKRLLDARQERIKLIQNSLSSQVNHEPMVVLISHPHGASKCVSVGKCLERKEEGDIKKTKEGIELVDCILTYDTPTCPGTGGGSINLIGNGEVCYAFAPHCASHSNGRNTSGLGWAKYVKSLQIRNIHN